LTHSSVFSRNLVFPVFLLQLLQSFIIVLQAVVRLPLSHRQGLANKEVIAVRFVPA
jgi:hypothetical protein